MTATVVASIVSADRATVHRATVALGAAGCVVRSFADVAALQAGAGSAVASALVVLDLDLAPERAAALIAETRVVCPRAALLGVGAQEPAGLLLGALAEAGVEHLVPKRLPRHGISAGPDGDAIFMAARHVTAETPGSGLGHYLRGGALLDHAKLTASDQRVAALSGLSDFMEALEIPEPRRVALEVAADELLMNALFDAPRDASWAPRFATQDRRQPVTLGPDEEVEITWGCDAQRFGIAVADPFGALEKRDVVRSLGLAAQGKMAPQPGRAGAGIGLAMVHRVVGQMVFDVMPGRRCEVFAFVRLAMSNRESLETGTSVHFLLGGYSGRRTG
ncbi:MAG: hypothetical protein IT370_23135 [Deltaproteobacteria bacterium]|nr:hypothetical protein [Deltaproteobacteria bacterium]